MALGAGDGGKLLVLDVKEFGEKAAGAGNLTCFKLTVATLGTLPVAMLHGLMGLFECWLPAHIRYWEPEIKGLEKVSKGETAKGNG